MALLAIVTMIAAGSLSSAQSGATTGPAADVSPQLIDQIAAANGEPVRALLMLPNPSRLEGSRAEVLETLRSNANETQSEVEAALSGDVTVINRFWITNMLLVEFPASEQTLNTMATAPGVRRIIPNFELTAPKPVPSSEVGPAAADELTWGIDKIQADRVWNELGVDGSGVRVATLDTGVDITHPDLAGKMVTTNPTDPNYPGGWMEFDSSGNQIASAPHDSAYHGTHVSGTIHGGSTSGVAIGVAPGAEMMHGLVIPGGGGTFAQVAAGMQWAIAPTDANGNPAGEPADIVNMSLGGNGFHDEMIAPTRAIRAAGTFPAFAIGNNCGSLGTASPGNVYESVAIGATDVDDNVAGFSCGAVVEKNQFDNPPAEWPDSYVKPDLSAPGVDVYSASPGGGYRTLDGTSMATPHTAGTAALMLSAAGELSVDAIQDALADNAFWDDRYADAPPDTRFGQGRIDAFESTRFVALNSGIEGTVTNAETGDPVAGATVTVNPGGRQVVTGDDGGYTLRTEPGTYTVDAAAFGYQPGSVADVTVAEGAFTTADIALTAKPAGQISGTVTLSESGNGIPGVTVSVLGVPATLTASTGTDGSYTISNVPVGTYQVAATHPVFQAPGPVEVTVTEGGTAQADFAFDTPARSVAVVDSSTSRAQQFLDHVFTPNGIPAEIYDWDELDQAAGHTTVVLGYGTMSSDYDPAAFQAFLDATDANGTGVIFTDHAFGSGSGLKQLSAHTGQPAAVDTSTAGSDSAESFYEVTATHPLLEGYAVGDRIVIDNSDQSKWVAWFDGYEGDGRQTLASLGRTADGLLGGGIGIDQRANNRHVLLSTHGVSGTRGPQDWTPEATDLFLNAITWSTPPAEPNQPYFAVHGLRVGPDVVKVDQQVSVAVDVTNVGGSTGTYNAELKVGGAVADTESVRLDVGETTTVEWTLSRDELGVYEVQVAYLSDSFRVRAPILDISASTVDAPGTTAGPLAGATVELIDDGQVTEMGTTDADGKLSFEIPEAVGQYTLVLRKNRTENAPAYLLHREVTLLDDDQVSFAPRVLRKSAAMSAGVGDNFAVRADLQLDSSDSRHSASVYLRPRGTAPYGYRFQPGPLVATLDTYEAVVVHQVSHLEQDWWLPSRVVGGLNWIDPYDITFTFGGPAIVDIAEVTVNSDREATVDWKMTDAYGLPFATVLATDVRPFVDLPDLAELEDIEGLLRAELPNEQKPILRMFTRDGEPVRAGSIDWSAQPFVFTVDESTPPGRYRLVLEVDTGGYANLVKDRAALRLRAVSSTSDPSRGSAEDSTEPTTEPAPADPDPTEQPEPSQPSEPASEPTTTPEDQPTGAEEPQPVG